MSEDSKVIEDSPSWRYTFPMSDCMLLFAFGCCIILVSFQNGTFGQIWLFFQLVFKKKINSSLFFIKEKNIKSFNHFM